MWCRICQQDVPGVARGDASTVCCPRCNGALSSGAAVAGAVDDAAHEPAELQRRHNVGNRQKTAEPVPDWGLVDWQADEDRRTLRRLCQSLGFAQLRVDAAQPRPADTTIGRRERLLSAKPVEDRSPTASVQPSAARRKPPWLWWLLMSVGLTTLVCGVVLLGLFFFRGHEPLWRMGLPLALGGQAVLLLGLIIQLEALWQHSHHADDAVNESDEPRDQGPHAVERPVRTLHTQEARG